MSKNIYQHAKIEGADDKRFEQQYNYLIDLLNMQEEKLQEQNKLPAITYVTEFLNGAGNYGSSKVGYYKHNGFVYLVGRLVPYTYGSAAFVLPNDCRPKNDVTLSACAGTTHISITIESNGNVISYYVSGTYISLDSLFFRADN